MVARVTSRRAVALLGSILSVLVAVRASAQCVGDCGGDGAVTINDLILGVNIALGNAPVSACPAFADQGEVTIAQLIKGVNNALNGCPPPEATATATATGGAATPTDTATEPVATATATAVASATSTATSAATATAVSSTATPVASSTATSPPTATVPASTATATPPATATHTAVSTATATAPSTATATAPNTATPSASATATHTEVPTASATPTVTVTPTITRTSTVTATPTETTVPPGESIAGRAALVSAGLGGIQSLIAAVVTAATNNGGPPAFSAATQGLPPPIDSDQCSISGVTTRSCTEMGSGIGKTISLVLGADHCVVPGPLGGTGEFDGSISIDSNPFFLNDCSPLAFLSGAYTVGNLTVMLRDAMQIGVDVAADLNGDVSLTGLGGSCLVTALSLSVTGTLSSTLPDGSGVQVQFFDTTVMMSNITYNADCVPLVYTLKFNGDAAFTQLEGLPPALTSGIPLGPTFDVEFVNFVLMQDASASPVTMTLDGTINSTCWNGQLILDTLAPIEVAAGQLCPSDGMISVTGKNNSMATVTYTSEMGVTVTPQGGQPVTYPSCLSEELLMCVPA